jgi:hypothetical protein
MVLRGSTLLIEILNVQSLVKKKKKKIKKERNARVPNFLPRNGYRDNVELIH